MPVRFQCEHCRQRLSIGSKKAGSVVACPKCRKKIVVPAEKKVTAPRADPFPAPDVNPSPAAVASLPHEPIGAEDEPAPVDNGEFEDYDYDYDAEYVYVEDEEAPSPRAPLNLDRVAVPRWILYAQGALLGLAALVGFALGILVGGAAPRGGGDPTAGGPWSVAASVAYDAGDNLPTADQGATVIVVPEDARPEAKAAVAPFRPGGPPLDPADPSLAAIQQIGGDAGKADAEGNVRLSVPRSGSYFVLILSAHRDRSGDRPAPQHLAEIGRYFASAPGLLGNSRYAWTKIRIRENEEITHVFR